MFEKSFLKPKSDTDSILQKYHIKSKHPPLANSNISPNFFTPKTVFYPKSSSQSTQFMPSQKSNLTQNQTQNLSTKPFPSQFSQQREPKPIPLSQDILEVVMPFEKNLAVIYKGWLRVKHGERIQNVIVIVSESFLFVLNALDLKLRNKVLLEKLQFIDCNEKYLDDGCFVLYSLDNQKIFFVTKGPEKLFRILEAITKRLNGRSVYIRRPKRLETASPKSTQPVRPLFNFDPNVKAYTPLNSSEKKAETKECSEDITDSESKLKLKPISDFGDILKRKTEKKKKEIESAEKSSKPQKSEKANLRDFLRRNNEKAEKRLGKGERVEQKVARGDAARKGEPGANASKKWQKSQKSKKDKNAEWKTRWRAKKALEKQRKKRERLLYDWNGEMRFKWKPFRVDKQLTNENQNLLWDKLVFREDGVSKTASREELLRAHFRSEIEKTCPTLKKPTVFYYGGTSHDSPEGASILLRQKASESPPGTPAGAERKNSAAKAPPAPKDEDFARFVRHTSGVVLRILQRHGYKERLGADEDGRLNPVLPPSVQSRCLGDFFKPKTRPARAEELSSSDDPPQEHCGWESQSSASPVFSSALSTESDSDSAKSVIGGDEVFYEAAAESSDKADRKAAMETATTDEESKANLVDSKSAMDAERDEEKRRELGLLVAGEIDKIDRVADTKPIYENAEEEEEISAHSNGFESKESSSSESEFAHEDEDSDPFGLCAAEKDLEDADSESDPLKEVYRDRKASIPLNYGLAYGDEYFLSKEFRYKNQPIPRQLDPRLQTEMEGSASALKVLQRPKDLPKPNKFQAALSSGGAWLREARDRRREGK